MPDGLTPRPSDENYIAREMTTASRRPDHTRVLRAREALALLRLVARDDRESEDGSLMAAFERCDPERLLELAIQEGAVGPLASALDELPDGVLPAPVIGRLTRLAAVLGHRQAQLREGLREAVVLLAARGIDVMLLKGAALVHSVYEGFGERPMADLDLLVPAPSAGEAHRVLREAGWRWDCDTYPLASYEGHHHLPPLVDPRRAGIVLEVHRSVLSVGHPFGVTTESFWASRRPVGELGARAWRPDLPHMLLHLAVHFAWTNWLGRDGWRSLGDAAALAGHMDADEWEAFVLLVGGTGAATSGYWTLRLARSLTGAPVPGGILERLRPELPDALLAALERHHARVLFGRDGCPSLALERWMWSLSMRPGASGHGDVRPWTADDRMRLPETARRGRGRPGAVPGKSSRENPLRRLAAWASWARDVAPGTVSRHR